MPAGRAVAGFLWLATTYLPGDTWRCWRPGFAFTARPACSTRSTIPRSRGIGLAVVLGLLLLSRFPNPYIEMLGLTAMILCLLEIARLRERPARLDRAGTRDRGTQPEVIRAFR